jgi:cytoskeletal protein CcmA (bactofilin family)
MREERGQIAGDLIVAEPLELWGNVGGSVTVREGGKFYLRGSILGNLFVEPGGRVHIYGQIHGSVTIFEKTKLIHSGVIKGDLINEGGRLFIERKSKVNGKVRTRSGETKVEAPVPAMPSPERAPRRRDE